MRVKKINVDNKVELKKKSKKVTYEVINGVTMRTDRLDTVLTVDSQGNVLAVSGKNPNKTQIGDNIYE